MSLKRNIIWIFALFMIVASAYGVTGAITSARVVDVNGSTLFLNYDDNTTSYADISLENPDALLEICADTGAELLNHYVTWDYKVLDKNKSVSIMPAQITAVNASNCTTVNVDLSRGKAFYPAVLSVALSSSPSMSSPTFFDMSTATGLLDGNYTFSIYDDGVNFINMTVTQAIDDISNPMSTDYDYIIVGILENGALKESHITNINDTIVFNKYGNNYTFNINGLLFLGDIAPPMLENLVPARDQNYVSRSAPIDFDVVDNTGVNISSFKMWVNGVRANTSGTLNLTSNDPLTNLSHHVNYIHNASFPNNAYVNVDVYVCDFNGNCLNDTYSFYVGKREEPGGGRPSLPEPSPPPEQPEPPAPEPVPEMPPENFSLYIYQVDVDGSMVAEDHEIIETPEWESNSSHSISVYFLNDGTGPVKDIRLLLTSPESVTVMEITPASIESLGPGSKAEFDAGLDAGTLDSSFEIQLTVDSDTASDSISIPIEVPPFRVEPLEFIEMPLFFYPLILLPLLLIFLRLLALNERLRDLIGNLISMFYAVSIADEKMLRKLITEKKVDDYRKIYVPQSTYRRYQALKKLRPIVVFPKDTILVSNMKKKYKVDDEMAHLLYFADKRNKVKFLTHKEVDDKIKKDFKHVKFLNPFEKFKQEMKKIGKGAVKEARKVEKEAKDMEKRAAKEVRKDIHLAEDKIDEFVHVRRSRHLQDYVQDAVDRNVPDKEIRDKMINAGWTEKEADYYLKNAKRDK